MPFNILGIDLKPLKLDSLIFLITKLHSHSGVRRALRRLFGVLQNTPAG